MEKGKELSPEIFPSAVRFVQRCPIRNRLSDFYLPWSEKSLRNIPGGFPCVLRMSGKRFLKGFTLRGGPAAVDGVFPLGRKRRADTTAYLLISPLLRVPFYLSGGERLAAPSSLGRGGGRGREENDLSQKDFSPRFHTHSPALLGGFAFYERFRNGGFTLNRQSRRKALSAEMPDPQGAGGADKANRA